MITLSAIVGNEEAVIERFIRSFAPAVDRFVIALAVGSQGIDATSQIYQKTCRELGKEWCVTTYDNKCDLPHVDDFSAARNESLQEAVDLSGDHSDYIIWADADDVLAPGAAESIRAAAASGEHDVYIMPYHVAGDKQIVHRERMIRADLGAKWVYPLHEQLAFPKSVTYRILPQAVIVHEPTAGRTSSRPRNLAILQRETKDAARNFFYLAQEHFNANEEREFKTAARASMACPGLGVLERYELLLQLAQCAGEPSKQHAAEAYALMPDRREALALICNYAIIDGDHEKAMTLADAMIALEEPKKTYWSLNRDWYGWKGDSLWNQCCRLIGKAGDADVNEFYEADKDFPTFSIVHATLGRPAQALAIRELWLSRAKRPENVDYVFGLHHDDAASIRALRGFRHTVTDRNGAAINYDTAAGATKGEIIIQAQDDCFPPQDWDVTLCQLIPDPSKPVFVAPFDGHRQDRLSVNSIMTRAYMDLKAGRDPGENGFFHTGYTTVFCDTENCVRAIQDGAAGVCEYIDARDFTIYHDHPFFNPLVPWDATYQWENSDENTASGKALFEARNPNLPADILERGSK